MPLRTPLQPLLKDDGLFEKPLSLLRLEAISHTETKLGIFMKSSRFQINFDMQPMSTDTTRRVRTLFRDDLRKKNDFRKECLSILNNQMSFTNRGSKGDKVVESC